MVSPTLKNSRGAAVPSITGAPAPRQAGRGGGERRRACDPGEREILDPARLEIEQVHSESERYLDGREVPLSFWQAADLEVMTP